MSLESLVTNLNLSRQLENAGCPQQSCYVWVNGHLSLRNDHLPSAEICSAFTAEELMRLLPEAVQDVMYGYLIIGRREKGGFVAAYFTTSLKEADDSLATACAELYLNLVQKGLIANAST